MNRRCEDFPCCGHYEPDTGEIFCAEANETAIDRERRLAHERIDREFDERLQREVKREAYEKAADDHRGDEEEPCKDCIADAEDQEVLFEEARREGDW